MCWQPCKKRMKRLARTRRLIAWGILLAGLLTSPVCQLSAFQVESEDTNEDQQELPLTSNLHPRNNPLVYSEWQVRDALRLPSSRIIYLQNYYGPSRYDFDEQELMPIGWVNTAAYKQYRRIFTVPEDPDYVYAVYHVGEKAQGGHYLYRHILDGSTSGQRVTFFRESITRPQYHITKDGVLFIYGRNGVIYRWSTQDGLARYEIEKPSDIEETRRNMFAPLKVAQVGESVCFYSLCDPRYPKKQLRDLLVFDGPVPKKTSLQNKLTGPACALDSRTLRFCTTNGFLDASLDDGQLKVTDFPSPNEQGQNLIVDNYFRLPNGDQFSLWRRPYQSYRKHDVLPMDIGYYNQFAKFENDRWTMLNSGLDLVLGNQRFQVQDGDGGVWLSASESSLAYFSPDGEYKLVSFDKAFGPSSIDFLKVDQSGLLLSVNHESDTLHFRDPKEILGDEPKSVLGAGWQVIFSRIPLEWDKRHRLMLFSLDPEQGLMDFQDESVASVVLPADTRLNQTAKVSVTRDTNDELWIFLNGNQDATFWRSNGKWITFEADANRTSKQVAFETRLTQGVDSNYVIGRRFNDYRVTFDAERKKIVYKNQHNRYTYFRNSRWSVANSGTELPEDYEFSQQACMIDGVTYIYGDTEFSWKLTDEQWDKHWETNKPRPWEKGDPIDYPFEGEQYFRIASDYPEGPYSSDESDWGYRASNILLTFLRAHDKLAIHYPSGIWNVIPAHGTPFENDSSFDQIWVDKYNRWFFQYPSVNGLHKYIVYDPPHISIDPVQKDLGKITAPDQKVMPQWQTNVDLPGLKMRYRFGQNEWSEWQDAMDSFVVPGFPEPGNQVLSVQLFSEPLPLRTHTLKYDLQIDYSLVEYIQPLLEKLKSDRYAERQDATNRILALGEAAIPYLKELTKERNAQIKLTAEMMVELLERTASPSDEDDDD